MSILIRGKIQAICKPPSLPCVFVLILDDYKGYFFVLNLFYGKNFHAHVVKFQ